MIEPRDDRCMTHANGGGLREPRRLRKAPDEHHGAYGYLVLPRVRPTQLESRVRQVLDERAAEDGLLLRNVFVDVREESPYAFAASARVAAPTRRRPRPGSARPGSRRSHR